MSEYQYILTYGATVETLGFNPAGWDKLGITLMRHEVYKSVLRTFSLSLRFYNISIPGVGTGGYQLIKQAYETDGVNAEISIEIKKRNPNTNDYDTFYTGLLDFTPGKFTFDRDLFVEISIIDSSILQKFIARDENEIDVFASKDLDDNAITPLTASEITLTPVDITLQTIKYIFHSEIINFNSGTYDNYVLPELSVSQPETTKNEIGDDYLVNTSPIDTLIYQNNYAFSVYVRFVWDFKYHIQVEARNFGGGYKNIEHRIRIEYKNSGGGDIYAANLFIATSRVTNPSQDFDYAGSIFHDQTILIQAGGYIRLFGYHVANLDNLETVRIVHNDGVIGGGDYPHPHILSVIVPGKAATTAKCLFLKDAFNKSFEIITGLNNALNSELLGVGGEAENDILLNGLQIRKYPSPKVFITFKKLFESLSARRGLGLWYNAVTNNLIIEKIDTFYNENKIFSFGEVSKFKEQAYNAYYSKIEGGYDDDGDYERVQGAYEFCVNKEFSTSSKVKETKNIRSPYKGSSVRIEELRNQPYDAQANIDNNSDNDIFIIDTDGINPVTISDSAIPYDGYEYFHTYYNTAFTPRQNVIRHGSIIAANSWKNTVPIKSQKSDKQFVLEVDNVDENSDIAVSELGECLIIPKLFTFQYYLTDAQIQSILLNPHGWGDFLYNGQLYSGFINKIELNSDYDGLANFELIAKNTDIIYRTFEDGDMHVFENVDQKING